jgi:hypothetical protein
VLISNFEAPGTSCSLTVGNVPWQEPYTAARYRIDEARHLEIVDTTVHDAAAYTASFFLGKNSVVLLRLTPASALPDEGPEVARIPLLLRVPVFDPVVRLVKMWLVNLLFG